MYPILRSRRPAAGSYRTGAIMIGLTATACVAALAFRTPLRSRYWAWRLERTEGVAERAALVTHLCNAGDAGRWGTETLLTHPDAQIRQLGVLVLQHVRSGWSHRQMMTMLEDPSEGVAELAALGLAIHGGAAVIPELERLFVEGDGASASAACVALGRLATREAIAAITALADQPTDPVRRAALIDALVHIGKPSCARPLLGMLGDHRPCKAPTRAERLLGRLAPLAARHGLVETPPVSSTSQPVAELAGQTVAERAAAALAQISGLTPPFASHLPDERRQDAERTWREWAGTPGETP